jgi:flagellar hook-length control protein FliK
MIQLLSIPRFLLQAVVAAPSAGASDQGFSALMAEAPGSPDGEPEAHGPLPETTDPAPQEEAKRPVQPEALREPGLQLRPADSPMELRSKQREKAGEAVADPRLPPKQSLPRASAKKDADSGRDEQIAYTAAPSSQAMPPPLLPQNSVVPPREASLPSLDQGALPSASSQPSLSLPTSAHAAETIAVNSRSISAQAKQVLVNFVQTADAEQAAPGAPSPDLAENLSSEEPNFSGQNLRAGRLAGQLLSAGFASNQNLTAATAPSASMPSPAAISADRRGASSPPTPAYGSFRVTADAVGPIVASAAIPAQVSALSGLERADAAADPVPTSKAAPVPPAQVATLLATRSLRPVLPTAAEAIESADTLQDLGAPTDPTPLRALAETNATTPLRAIPPASLQAQILHHAPEAQLRQVEVMLAPEELGRLKFQIRHHGETVSIFLSAERADTMDMLRRNGEDLLREFRQAGFAGASLEFGAWGQGQSRQDQPPSGFALPDDFTASIAIARPALVAMLPAEAGGLNLRL